MISRFGTTHKTLRGSLGVESIKPLAFMFRTLELCSKRPIVSGGRLDMMRSWDAFEPDEIAARLEAAFGKKNPLEFLLKKGHLDDLIEVLNQHSLDFKPVASEFIKILNKVYPPHTGIREKDDREWNSFRSAIYRFAGQLTARFDRCRDWVPIRGAGEERAAKRKGEKTPKRKPKQK
jgi:hypothetical protein